MYHPLLLLVWYGMGCRVVARESCMRVISHWIVKPVGMRWQHNAPPHVASSSIGSLLPRLLMSAGESK